MSIDYVYSQRLMLGAVKVHAWIQTYSTFIVQGKIGEKVSGFSFGAKAIEFFRFQPQTLKKQK